MGLKWESFIERYRSIILKIQKLRGVKKVFKYKKQHLAMYQNYQKYIFIIMLTRSLLEKRDDTFIFQIFQVPFHSFFWY